MGLEINLINWPALALRRRVRVNNARVRGLKMRLRKGRHSRRGALKWASGWCYGAIVPILLFDIVHRAASIPHNEIKELARPRTRNNTTS